MLDRDEIGRLLAATASVYRPILATKVFSGLRVMELLGLCWRSVNLEEGVVHVRYQLTRDPALDARSNPQPRSEELSPFTRHEIDVIAAELGPTDGALVVVAAETGLRTNEWVALERRDVDKAGRAVAVQRRASDGVVTPYPKTVRSRRRVPLTTRALSALEALPARLDTPLLFPAPSGGLLWLDNWRTREWYDALDAAGVVRRGPTTFATRSPPKLSRPAFPSLSCRG